VSKQRIKSYILLLIVTAIWGIAGPVIKYTLPDFPPMIFLTYRFFISAILMIPIAIVFKVGFPKTRHQIFWLTLAGLLGSSVNLALSFFSFDKSTVLDVSIIGNTGPIFIILGGILFLKEKVTKREMLGIIITLIGTVFVVVEPLFENGLFEIRSLTGNLLAILANISWVLYILITKKEMRHNTNVLFMTTYMFVLGFISSLPFALFQSGGVTNLLYIISLAPFKAHLGVWYMAVFSGSLAYFLYQEGQKNIEASEATLFSYLSPVFAAPLAVFWLKEEVTIPFLIGTTIIILGVFIAEYRRNQVGKSIKRN